MPESIPLCRNAVKFRDHQSQMEYKGETEEAWVFQCRNTDCNLIQLVSKEGVRDRTKFELAAKRRAEEEERRLRLEKRPKIFT